MAVDRVYQTVSAAALYWCKYCSFQNTTVQYLPYVLENLGFRFLGKERDFLFSETSRPTLGPGQSPIQGYRTFFTTGYSDRQRSSPQTWPYSGQPNSECCYTSPTHMAFKTCTATTGRSWDQIPAEARFSAPFQNGPAAHPHFYTLRTGSSRV